MARRNGLAEDVRRYRAWMRDEAHKRIGHLYPPVEITAEMANERPDLKPLVGQKLTVIAWLWARTVKSPNPAFPHVDVPLASTFMLVEQGGQRGYVQPVIESGGYRFTVKRGTPPAGCGGRNNGRQTGCTFSLPDVRHAHIVRLHSSRRQGRTNGYALDGDRRRGPAGTGLSSTDRGTGSNRAAGKASLETGGEICQEAAELHVVEYG